MVDFRSMGKLEYMTKYRIERKTKIVRGFIGIIENIDDTFFNICISTYLDEKHRVYNNLVVFKDKSGTKHKFSFDSFYLMRLDHFIEQIKRTYKSKVEKEASVLTYSTHHWNSSTIKTDSNYQVNIGKIKMGKYSDKSVDVMITVDKNNGVVCMENDAFVKPVTYNEGVPQFDPISIEIFSLGDTGYAHFVDKEIYHEYYDDNGDHHTVQFLGLVNAISPLENLTPFYQNHETIIIDDKETINIEYDVHGIYKSNNSNNKYPVFYEEFFADRSNDPHVPDVVYSLHPLHIDYNNFSLNNSDSLYALDYYDSADEANMDEYMFTRETRKLSQKDINKINSDIKNNRHRFLVPSIDNLIYDVLYK